MAGRKRRITWTLRASGQRMEIMEYWFQKNGSMTYPRKLERLIHKSLELLADHPEIGTAFSEHPPMNFKVVRGYRLYYTFNDASLTF